MESYVVTQKQRNAVNNNFSNAQQNYTHDMTMLMYKLYCVSKTPPPLYFE